MPPSNPFQEIQPARQYELPEWYNNTTSLSNLVNQVQRTNDLAMSIGSVQLGGSPYMPRATSSVDAEMAERGRRISKVVGDVLGNYAAAPSKGGFPSPIGTRSTHRTTFPSGSFTLRQNPSWATRARHEEPGSPSAFNIIDVLFSISATALYSCMRIFTVFSICFC